jgi:hypothetical protein
MITYKFGSEAPVIFKTGTKTTTDLLFVPLNLQVPHELMKVEGVDGLQKRIEEAVENMVKGLNEGGKL